MTLEKSNWKAFLANVELMYVGATFNKSVDEIVDAIEKYTAPPFKADRKYISGVTDLKFEKPDGTISHLDKRGVVYTLGDYFLIYEKNNESIIVYRVK